MIAGNSGTGGDLDTDAFQKAILQYRNTPDPSTKASPALIVFGRTIKDLIPILPGRYSPHPYWRETMARREETLQERHRADGDRWLEHTKPLTPLKIGDPVRVQNQTGNFPNKWDKTGVVVEVRQFHQYVVKMTGTGRVTLRNRKFLRKYRIQEETPTHPQLTIPTPPTYIPPTSRPPPVTTMEQPPPVVTTPPKAPLIPSDHPPLPKTPVANQTPQMDPPLPINETAAPPNPATPRTTRTQPQRDLDPAPQKITFSPIPRRSARIKNNLNKAKQLSF